MLTCLFAAFGVVSVCSAESCGVLWNPVKLPDVVIEGMQLGVTQ